MPQIDLAHCYKATTRPGWYATILPRPTPTRATQVYLDLHLPGSHKTASGHYNKYKHMVDGRTSDDYTNPNLWEGTRNLLAVVHDKQLNCRDLITTIITAIGLPTAAHFTQINSSRKQGTKALAIHLMVAAQQAKETMLRIEQTYGETRLTELATKFPLGQCLCLAPLANKLNEKTWRALTNSLKNKPCSVKKLH